MGVAAGFTLFATALAAAAPATAPPCPQNHRCHHVVHVGPTGSDTGHVAWDSKELFRPGPIAIGINYSPKLPNDAGIRIDPIGQCGIHFVLPARFTGFATRCGKGRLPLHVQVANVTLKHVRVGVTYWTPGAPQFTG
jgi:hypothetical protein